MRKLLLSIFSHRSLALLRWDFHFLKIEINNLLFFNLKKFNKIIGEKGEIKLLNLGSGPRGIVDNKWINIDGFKDKNVHYLCNFSKKLPFVDNLFNGIFCEHVLEHFDYENGQNLMKECLRILKNDGVIRIIVPNGRIILNDYFNNPQKIVTYKECTTGEPMEAVNKWFYQRYEHQCIYDAPYLIDMLKKAGFKDAVEVQFKTQKLSKLDLNIDDEKYAYESLYVEAIK